MNRELGTTIEQMIGEALLRHDPQKQQRSMVEIFAAVGEAIDRATEGLRPQVVFFTRPSGHWPEHTFMFRIVLPERVIRREES